jgi:hypothetical protein
MPATRPSSPWPGRASIFGKGRLSPFGQVLFGAAYQHISTGVIAVTDPTTPILPVANPSTLFPGPNA